MEQQATDAILATRTALSQASALAVQYSFSILGALILLILGWVMASFVSYWAFEGISRVRGIDETLARFFTNVLHYALLILVFITVLGQFGVQTASIIAALGAAGLAIGLALGHAAEYRCGHHASGAAAVRVGEYIATATVAGTCVKSASSPRAFADELICWRRIRPSGTRRSPITAARRRCKNITNDQCSRRRRCGSGDQDADGYRPGRFAGGEVAAAENLYRRRDVGQDHAAAALLGKDRRMEDVRATSSAG